MPSIPASAVFLVAAVATWPIFAWEIRGRFGVRAGMVPPLVTLVLLPFVVAGALWAYTRPLVGSPADKCGTGDMMLLFAVVPLTVAAVVAGVLWAAYVASPGGRRRADATLRGAAVVVVAGGAVLAASGVVRSIHAPDADGWASSLPQPAVVPDAVRATAFEHFAWSFYDIRRDEACDLWVVTRPGPEGRTAILALGCALVPRSVGSRDLAGIAPPRGWVAEALGGLLAGLASIGLGVVLSRRHTRRLAGRPAMHLGSGWLALDDGSPPLHLPELEPHEAGPVIVRLGEASTASYRTTGAPSVVHVVALGTAESVREIAGSIGTVGYVMALAVVALSCAPLAIT
jgi:hypothetical protein